MKISTKRLVSILVCVSVFASLSACTKTNSESSVTSTTVSEGSAVPETTGVSSETQSETQKTGANAFYDGLPYSEVFPLDEGPILINGVEKEIKIGFSQTGFNHPWRIEMNNSAQAEVDRHSNVSMVITDGNVDIVKQSSDIRDLIAQGVDVIVMSPVESGALANAVNEATAAGIPVIVLDRDVTTDKTLFIGQSNFNLGASVAKVLVEKLNGKGNVLEITGLMGSSPAIGRHDGFMSVISQYPDIKVLAQGDGQWIREPAAKLMDDWLITYPDIDAVYSHAEESSWGALLAIDRAGRSGDGILQFTCDGSNEGFRSVKSGEFMADGNYTPYIGQLGIRAALYTLMGQKLENIEKYDYGYQLVLPDLPVVVAENADTWIGKGWGE